MEKIKIEVLNAGGEVLAEYSGSEEAAFVYDRPYCEGDRLRIEAEPKNSFWWIQVDDAVGKSMVYLTGTMEYVIPFGEQKLNLSPKAFEGDWHLISVRKAKAFEYSGYRCLSVNVNDQHGQENAYPHASANVETRGESVFAAMNAIDGTIVPQCHGRWPYESWGINCREDARWRLDFGRTVKADKIIVYLRADFPHDNWWTEGKVTFSDGTEMILPFEKGGHGQEFCFEPKQIEWLEFSDLKKADNPSPFPALTQFEVYGTEQE